MASRQPTLQNRPSNLREHESIFRALVESVRDYAIVVLDPAGAVVTWNPGAERMQQYTADEIIGRHFSVFYPEDERRADTPGRDLQTAKENGRFEGDAWRIRKDGSRFCANVVITPLTDSDGKLIGYGKITRDLTERRAAEQRYRLLIEGVVDYAIFSLDSQGNVTSWNSGAERIKQYSADEIIGRHFSTFYTPEDRERGLPQHVLRTAEEAGHWEGEGWRVRKDGSLFWSLVVVTAIRDEEGHLTGFSKVTRDMSDRKRLMDELKRHAEELEEEVAERKRTNDELEAFSYSVSHDLRAPLRAIEGFASALREDYGNKLDETGQDYLNEIMSASTRMNRLVQDLLDYGRLSRIEISPAAVPLKPLLQRILNQGPEEYRTVSLSGDFTRGVLAHEPTLTQVLLNLLSNAFKFHDRNVTPRVEVAVDSPGNGNTRISVKDNGIGVAPEHQEKIFKVFERLHGMDEFPGTGIGLAIVKRGMERMGGSCGVESAPGKGSIFWVELPSERGR